MHADVCDPSDQKAVERFNGVLQRLGAKGVATVLDSGSALSIIQIGESQLIIYNDLMSIDGPDDLVQKILEEFRHDKA
jgi:hypothetical protein